MFNLYARNKVTDEVLFLGQYEYEEDAQMAIDCDVEWEEDDNPEDWEFLIEETDFVDEPVDIDDDCGFDPYAGCYTYDC